MLFYKNSHPKKHLAAGLILLLILTAVPFYTAQSSVDLLYFRAVAGSASIKLKWETAQELDNLGFDLYRGISDDRDAATKLNSSLIPGNTGSPTGAYYEWVDNNVNVGTTYYYWLVDTDINGIETPHGPVTSAASGGSSFPTAPPPGSNTATPTATSTATRTATATTQSGGSGGTQATQTPTRTPSAAPTTANPTPTIQVVAQPTSATNNAPPTTVSQSPNTTTGSAATTQPTIDLAPTQAPDETAEPANPEPEPTPQAVTQSDPEGETLENNQVIAQQIGTGSESGQADNDENSTAQDGNGRPTALLMALIVSVVLLVIGGGSLAILLINRKNQTRI